MLGGLIGMMNMIAALARGFERNTAFTTEGIDLEGTDDHNTGTTQLTHANEDTVCLELVGRTSAAFGDRVFINIDLYCTKEAVCMIEKRFNMDTCYVVDSMYTDVFGEYCLLQAQLKVTNPSEEAVAISFIHDLSKHVVNPF